MKPIQDYMYNPHELQLAEDIARRLNDPTSIKQFLRYTKRYSHKALREKLNYVCSLPDHKILTSRAAYFVFLVERMECLPDEPNNKGIRNGIGN